MPEILPNKLRLSTFEAVSLAEFEGFLKAELLLTMQLTGRTKISVKLIQEIHKTALSHLYDFAGKWRNVNMSKGGFMFAPAQFLDNSMQQFEREFLLTLPKKFTSFDEFLNTLSAIHAEFLFIHPFREGNGRTARILVDLICRKYGYDVPAWERIDDEKFKIYVVSVHQGANQNYAPMNDLLKQLY